REVFSRAPRATSAPQARGRINQMNPDIMINETTNSEVYLNPQFRYSGSSTQDDSRLRSSPLNFSSVGMEVTDADGDGKNEIFLLDDRALHAYTFSAGQMQPKGEFRLPASNTCLNVRSMPHPSGKAWIIVNTVDSGGVPNAYILNWSNGQFSEVMSKVRWYLNVVKLPPNFRPTLIGQEANPPRLFRMGVHEMNRQGDTLVSGGQLNLPTEANVFSFTWLPASKGEIGGEKLIVLTRDESLRTYNSKLTRLAVTSEQYSGSAVGLAIDPSMPGMKHDNRQQLPSVFYIPMRMPAVDLERDGTWKLIVNRPISTAAQIFDRYRFFPQSEIHCLYWDGMGLNLQWKTRRIKGSMVDYTITDADNDGIPDLTVCVNTHPGALGVSSRRTMVLIYPLDISRTNPDTNPDKSDLYD
ncbi:MAG: VCBS repeat-containing protein, partial [Desulfovibrio sp.]|nr:VCBS repeat-containing protein [Desulfovibrio sp.]